MVSEKWPAEPKQLVWNKRRELYYSIDGSLPPLVKSVGQVVLHEGEWIFNPHFNFQHWIWILVENASTILNAIESHGHDEFRQKYPCRDRWR
jgi:hypothetical protein